MTQEQRDSSGRHCRSCRQLVAPPTRCVCVHSCVPTTSTWSSWSTYFNPRDRCTRRPLSWNPTPAWVRPSRSWRPTVVWRTETPPEHQTCVMKLWPKLIGSESSKRVLWVETGGQAGFQSDKTVDTKHLCTLCWLTPACRSSDLSIRSSSLSPRARILSTFSVMMFFTPSTWSLRDCTLSWGSTWTPTPPCRQRTGQLRHGDTSTNRASCSRSAHSHHPHSLCLSWTVNASQRVCVL